jgi:hypothetical protein
LHDTAVGFPDHSETEKAKEFSSRQVCPEWRDGYLTVDGTTLALFQKPGFYGDAYFDRSSKYSINVQVCYISFIKYTY